MRTVIVIICMIPVMLSSQIPGRSADAFQELESGSLTLRIANALNGHPVIGASVEIETLGAFVTDEEGKIVFPPPEQDTIVKVIIRAEGYIPTEYPLEIMAGTIFFNRISISPVMDMKNIRIVLDWDRNPRDLDAHFVKTGSGGYHLSFRNMKVLTDGTGKLDIDAMNGYGPETITVNEVSTRSVYEYSVHDYTNAARSASRALSESKATVKVYGEGKLLNVFQVPRKKEGTIWNVFKIEQGQIREVRQLGNN